MKVHMHVPCATGCNVSWHRRRPENEKNNDVKKAKSVTCTCTAFNFYEVELTIVPTGKSGTELITTLRGCSSPSTTRTVAS